MSELKNEFKKENLTRKRCRELLRDPDFWNFISELVGFWLQFQRYNVKKWKDGRVVLTLKPEENDKEN